MDKLVESLMEELNCNTVFTIPLFGGIPVLESVVVTWIIMAIMMIGSLILVKGLKMRNIGKKQAALERFYVSLPFLWGSSRRRRKSVYSVSDHGDALYCDREHDRASGLQIADKGSECDGFPCSDEHCAGGGSGNPETGHKRMAQKLCGADSDHCADQCTGTVYPAAFPLYAVVRKRAWCRCCHGADQVSASGGGSASVQRIFRYI